MPLMNGIEAVHRIRRAIPSMRIVCMSSNSDNDTIRECFQKGASGFVPKTAPGTELVIELRSRTARRYLSLATTSAVCEALFRVRIAIFSGWGWPPDRAADRSPPVARRGQDDERGCCRTQPHHTYRCVSQVQADEHAQPEHKCSSCAVRPSASCRLCLTRRLDLHRRLQSNRIRRGTFPWRKPRSRANAVSHNSSSRQTNVSTLAVLRVLYVQESHARRFPSASRRSALEHRMQQQAVDSGTGIATCGTDCTSAFEFHDAFGIARTRFNLCGTLEHGATCSCGLSRWKSTCPGSTREHRDECTSAHSCTTASSSAAANRDSSRHSATRQAGAGSRLEA